MILEISSVNLIGFSILFLDFFKSLNSSSLLDKTKEEAPALLDNSFKEISFFFLPKKPNNLLRNRKKLND